MKHPALLGEAGATLALVGRGIDSMIANYTDHAANERTLLAWIRTGLAVIAFGFFLVKLNIFVDAAGGGGLRHLPAGDIVGVVARCRGGGVGGGGITTL